MSPCDTEQLLLLAHGELDPPQAAELQRHLDACPACAAELARLRDALAALDRLPTMEPQADVAERILADGREAVQRRRTLRPSFVRRYRYALAAAAILAMAVGWSLIDRPIEPTDAQLDPILGMVPGFVEYDD